MVVCVMVPQGIEKLIKKKKGLWEMYFNYNKATNIYLLHLFYAEYPYSE